ncbi:HET-E1 [Symbiodinium microadriaticum]|nr:HET-E1 [Symbiodinium microadriaticum]
MALATPNKQMLEGNTNLPLILQYQLRHGDVYLNNYNGYERHHLDITECTITRYGNVNRDGPQTTAIRTGGPGAANLEAMPMPSDELTLIGTWMNLALIVVPGTAFHDALDDPGTPWWFRHAAELGYDMMSRGVAAVTMADLVDELAMETESEAWFLNSEKYRSGLRRAWAREQHKRERERGPLYVDQNMRMEAVAFAGNLVEYLRKSMLAQQYHDLNYYPPCWGHDGYDREQHVRRRGARDEDPSEPSSSSNSTGENDPPEDETRERSRSRTPAGQPSTANTGRTMEDGVRGGLSEARCHRPESEEEQEEPEPSDVAYLVQKKWLLKAKRPKTPYQTAKAIWKSARPEHRTSSTRTLAPAAPRSLLSRRCATAPWHRRPEDEEDTEEVAVEELESEEGLNDDTRGAEGAADGPEADTAEGLWLILLSLDPYGGSLSVPADLATMPMTLPTEIVENVRATLAEHTGEEIEEMRAALPNVLSAIREELTGLLDEAANSRSSSSRPTPMAEEPGVAEEEEEVSDLMQRTVTGMLRTSKRGQGIREDRLALHQELQDFPQGMAAHLARRLRQRLGKDSQAVEDWPAVEAVLAANSDYKEEGEEQAAQDEWIEKWTRRLIKVPRPGQAASSRDEVPIHPTPLNETQLYEDRQREEEAQEREDSELYEWHQQQLAAAEAKKEDELILQTHLGLSSRRPTKKVRLTVEITGRGIPHYSEFEIKEGEEMKLGVTLSAGAPGYYLNGVPISQADAREHLEKEEARLRANQPEQTQARYNMDDPATKEMYGRWCRGQATVDDVAKLGGRDMVTFFEAIKEIEAFHTLPDTMPPAADADPAQEIAGPTLASTIRQNYLGEHWKEILREQRFQESYRAWLTGTLGDDMIILRYGSGAMALYRLFLERGFRFVPGPVECGSDSNSEAETEEFQPGTTKPEEPGADDAETLILEGGLTGEWQQDRDGDRTHSDTDEANSRRV